MKKFEGEAPKWELEPMEGQEKAVEQAQEAAPSVAEARVAEIAKELEVVAPEKPEEKTAKIEAVQAQIAEMVKPKIEQSVAEKAPVQAERSPEKPSEAPAQKKSLIEKFLGRKEKGETYRDVEAEIEQEETKNNIKATVGLQRGMFASIAVAVGGAGAWVAAGSGIGTAATIAGVPLMSAAAIAAAPVSAAILAGAGAVWGIRKFLNSSRAKAAKNELYA